jgi:pimeloyl-ACP methyl ester carboxylesterase
VLALCEDDVLKLQFAGAQRDEQAKELLGYLKVIEAGLNDDGGRPETYLVDGRRSLTLARLSRSDRTLQFYTVSLPPHWDPRKLYPLYVQLHGRGPDLALGWVNFTYLPYEKDGPLNGPAISIVPWLRGNGAWREDNGSEPDIWEAIDDVKTFATVDPDRFYISGHSWGGDDVWSIVQRTPDLWAAAGIMSGHPGSAPRELGLLANARYVPFYLWMGDQDPIPNRRPAFEYFRDSLAEVGDATKLVVAQGVAHNPRPQDTAALEVWLLEHVRHRPSHFTFVIDTPRHRGIWGISIPRRYPDAYGNAEPRANFECWIDGSTARIQTANATRLDVDPGPAGLNLSGTVTLIVNGTTRFSGPVPSKTLSFEGQLLQSRKP